MMEAMVIERTLGKTRSVFRREGEKETDPEGFRDDFGLHSGT